MMKLYIGLIFTVITCSSLAQRGRLQRSTGPIVKKETAIDKKPELKLEIQGIIAKGDELASSGKQDEAIKQYREAGSKDPENKEIQGIVKKKIAAANKARNGCDCTRDLEYDSERNVAYFKLDPNKPPYTGTCESFYPNTEQTLFKSTFVDGKENGKTIKYYKTGIKNAQLNHSFGKKDGEWKFWGEDSTLLWSKNYLADKLHGEQKDFYDDGKVKKIEHYENGVKEGKTEEFYPDGGLKKEIGYQENQFHGPYKKYADDSTLIIEKNYEKGLEDGPNNYYYGSGAVGYKKVFKKGKPEGTWNFYYENGNEKAIEIYKKGKKEGLWKSWYDNQKTRFEILYKKDKIITKKEYDRYGREL